MSKSKLVKLAGSERTAPKGSKALTKSDRQQTIEITLRLRSRAAPAALDRLATRLGAQAPAKRKYLTREQLSYKYGAKPADVKKVERFAHESGLTVSQVHFSSRVVKLRGTVEALRTAFGVTLKKIASKGRVYRVRQGAVSIPTSLKNIVVGVHGLDSRPVAKAHFRKRGGAGPRNASDGSLTVAQIAKAYNFPTGLDGTGQTIAIIELNGTDKQGKASDTGFETSDLQAFFKKNKLAYPDITALGIDGGANLPGKPQGGDDEVVLDIEVAGAVSPGAKIVVYFAPNTSNGFIDAVKAAVHDTDHKPSVVSISWGGPEDPDGQMSPSYMDALNEAVRDASTVGVTVCIAAGDNGSADMSDQWDGKPHVDFPASSPYALACGGTKLTTTAAGGVKSEAVWNEGTQGGAGGGGVSNYFARPSYQANAKVPVSPKKKVGRGVPDVTGDGDPYTGYQIYLDGKSQVIGGTSAVAPLMAGLLARINQKLAKKKSTASAGFINTLIYGTKGIAAFRDIVTGNNDIYGSLNGLYTAKAGWDACSGLGVADGTKLLNLLS
jgi:kumamolisin